MVRRTAAQAAETRRDLTHAAAQVFGECGFAGATLEQIAERAGVTRGALYHHFDDKADIYDAVLRQEADRVLTPLMADLAGDGPPLERLRAFFVAYCSALQRDTHFRRVVDLLLFGAAGAPARARERTRRGYETWLHAIVAVLDEAHEAGALRERIVPRDAARAVVVCAVGLTTSAVHAPELFALHEGAGAPIDVLIAGMAVDAQPAADPTTPKEGS